ncbi:hypothetical protein [Nitratifractor sp.]|uniref:hypothetical protein n=1 Tax=Nitratifractor sp. TaxID=2268144 RepID=UPI0025F57ACA|nr:hypothetical protein [Nitratifractor sp.]
MNFLFNHFYIFLSIFFAVISQLIIKWKMSSFDLSHIPSVLEKFLFVASLLSNPYIILSIVLTLLSGLSWMIAMTKFELSYAYPYTALGYVIVLLFSFFLFHESLTLQKIAGVLLVVLGIIIASKSR